MKRALLTACGLLVLVIAAGAATYALTPSAGNAEAMVRTLARHDVASDLGAPVPPKFAESIVASEDSRFYAEPGIDPIGMARAAWMTLTGSRADPGGSTLSQQLAKQLYTHGRTGVLQDTKQVALAVKLNSSA
jgi:penicillin-binding protein 1A